MSYLDRLVRTMNQGNETDWFSGKECRAVIQHLTGGLMIEIEGTTYSRHAIKRWRERVNCPIEALPAAYRRASRKAVRQSKRFKGKRRGLRGSRVMKIDRETGVVFIVDSKSKCVVTIIK